MAWEGLEARINAVTIAHMNNVLEKGRVFAKEEVPKGESGELEKNIKITPARKRAGLIVGEIIFDTLYAWAVWKGIPESKNQHHSASKQWMIFDNWPGGNYSFTWKTDGKWHFKEIWHVTKANDFIGRMRKRIIDYAYSEFPTFGQKVRKAIGLK